MALCIPDILKWGDLDYAVSIAKCKVNSIRPREMNGEPAK